MDAYRMAVSNVARFIRGQRNLEGVGENAPLDAFTASTVLAAAFCKIQGEVLADIVSVPRDPGGS
jgi:hypothetical protein